MLLLISKFSVLKKSTILPPLTPILKNYIIRKIMNKQGFNLYKRPLKNNNSQSGARNEIQHKPLDF